MGNPTQFFLPRSQVPANFGDLLRNAGLGEGISWGGSELDFRPDLSPDAIAKAEALAAGAPPGSTTADVMRFLAMQQGGTGLPGLPLGGAGDEEAGLGSTSGASTGPGGGIVAGRGGEPATAGRVDTTPDATPPTLSHSVTAAFVGSA